MQLCVLNEYLSNETITLMHKTLKHEPWVEVTQITMTIMQTYNENETQQDISKLDGEKISY